MKRFPRYPLPPLLVQTTSTLLATTAMELITEEIATSLPLIEVVQIGLRNLQILVREARFHYVYYISGSQSGQRQPRGVQKQFSTQFMNAILFTQD